MFLFVCLLTDLSIYLLIYLSFWLSIYPSIYFLLCVCYPYPSIHLSSHLSIYLSIYLSIPPLIYLSIRIYVSMYVRISSIYLFSIYLHIYLSIYLIISFPCSLSVLQALPKRSIAKTPPGCCRNLDSFKSHKVLPSPSCKTTTDQGSAAKEPVHPDASPARGGWIPGWLGWNELQLQDLVVVRRHDLKQTLPISATWRPYSASQKVGI